jgi:hypothetical protein
LKLQITIRCSRVAEGLRTHWKINRGNRLILVVRFQKLSMTDTPGKPTNPIHVIIGCVSSLLTILVIWIFIAPTDPSDSNKPLDTTALSVACFAIAGIVAIMPWQAAVFFQATDLNATNRFVSSGAHMSLGSLFFLAATILKYILIQREPLIKFLRLNINMDGFTLLTSIPSMILFVLGAIHAGIGFYRFAAQLMDYLYQIDTDQTVSKKQE